MTLSPIMVRPMEVRYVDDRCGGSFVADSGGRLQCPYCGGYEVGRMYLASLGLDSCECRLCRARWDEDPANGEFRGRGHADSVIAPRER